MREGLAAITLLALGASAAVFAAGINGNPELTTALAALAAALAGFGGVILLAPAVRHPYAPVPPMVGATLVLLRDSFRSGPLGRQAIVATVVSLEHHGAAAAAPGMNPDEERRLIALDPPAFRAWLDGRLDRLEQET